MTSTFHTPGADSEEINEHDYRRMERRLEDESLVPVGPAKRTLEFAPRHPSGFDIRLDGERVMGVLLGGALSAPSIYSAMYGQTHLPATGLVQFDVLIVELVEAGPRVCVHVDDVQATVVHVTDLTTVARIENRFIVEHSMEAARSLRGRKVMYCGPEDPPVRLYRDA